MITIDKAAGLHIIFAVSLTQEGDESVILYEDPLTERITTKKSTAENWYGVRKTSILECVSNRSGYDCRWLPAKKKGVYRMYITPYCKTNQMGLKYGAWTEMGELTFTRDHKVPTYAVTNPVVAHFFKFESRGDYNGNWYISENREWGYSRTFAQNGSLCIDADCKDNLGQAVSNLFSSMMPILSQTCGIGHYEIITEWSSFDPTKTKEERLGSKYYSGWRVANAEQTEREQGAKYAAELAKMKDILKPVQAYGDKVIDYAHSKTEGNKVEKEVLYYTVLEKFGKYWVFRHFVYGWSKVQQKSEAFEYGRDVYVGTAWRMSLFMATDGVWARPCFHHLADYKDQIKDSSLISLGDHSEYAQFLADKPLRLLSSNPSELAHNIELASQFQVMDDVIKAKIYQTHPIAEQLFKAGFRGYAHAIRRTFDDGYWGDAYKLSHLIGDFDEDKTTLPEKLGIPEGVYKVWAKLVAADPKTTCLSSAKNAAKVISDHHGAPLSVNEWIDLLSFFDSCKDLNADDYRLQRFFVNADVYLARPNWKSVLSSIHDTLVAASKNYDAINEFGDYLEMRHTALEAKLINADDFPIRFKNTKRPARDKDGVTIIDPKTHQPVMADYPAGDAIHSRHEAISEVIRIQQAKVNAVKHKNDENQYAEQVGSIKDLAYAPNDSDLEVVIPNGIYADHEKPEDNCYTVENEGNKMHHCIFTNYKDQLVSGTYRVVFIRDKKNPTQVLCTVGFKTSGTINQTFLEHDRSISKDIALFILRWVKARSPKIAVALDPYDSNSYRCSGWSYEVTPTNAESLLKESVPQPVDAAASK